MSRLLIHWFVSAILLLVVSHVVPGFLVSGFLSALAATLVLGLINATLGLVLRIVTAPITILTLGLFLLVINAVMLLLTSTVVPGFRVHGFMAAFWGALVLALLQMVMRWVAPKRRV